MITIKVDTKGVEAKLNKAKKEIGLTMVKELNRFGTLTVGDAKRRAPVDEGFLIGKITFDPATVQNLKTKVVVACNYAAYVEFGTRKFATAYVATLPPNWQAYAASFRGKTTGTMDDFILRIMEWVKRKGIGRVKIGKQTIEQTQEADAYAIALHILRNGIKPQPFLFPAVQSNIIKLKERLK